MSQGQTSVGSGSGNDENENPVVDSAPSRTFGAESGHSDYPPKLPAPRPATASPDDETETEAEDQAPHAIEDEALPGTVLGSMPLEEKSADKAFPDGPNVAPSPWEKDAAQGKT